jgi:hypothetical protein
VRQVKANDGDAARATARCHSGAERSEEPGTHDLVRHQSPRRTRSWVPGSPLSQRPGMTMLVESDQRRARVCVQVGVAKNAGRKYWAKGTEQLSVSPGDHSLPKTYTDD